MRRPSLLTIVFLVACGRAGGTPQATRTDSAGIEIVQNSAEDRLLDWPVTATDTLVDPGSDTVFQGEARALGLAVDSMGRLIAIDGGFNDRRVLRRADDGSWHQVGRKGGGPGEYQFAITVSASPAGELLVADFGQRAYVHFGPDDKPLSNIPWSAFGPGFPRSGGFVGGGVISLQGIMGDTTPSEALHFLTSTDTLVLATLRQPPQPMVMFESCHVGFGGGPIFSPDVQWTGNPTRVAVAGNGEYRIDIWEQGKLVRSIRRALPPRPATKALAQQDLGEGQRIVVGSGPPCLIPASEIVEKRGVAPTIPAIKRLAMGWDGAFWVERWTVRGEPKLRDLFDSTGAYLGTLSGEIPWPQAWLPDGRYLAVLADADSLPVVVRYGVGGAVRRE